MSAALPLTPCACAVFDDLNADMDREPWGGLQPVFLREVATGLEPNQATSVRAGRTETELRVLFCALDARPWATFTEPDAPLYKEEAVEIFIDPVGDLTSYFEFEVNPLNAVLDLVARRNRNGWLKNLKWRCEGLRTAVRRTTSGWNAEFAIPFAAIVNEAPRPSDEWRVNFCRIDRPEGIERELSAWSPTGLAQFHVPSRFGTMRFV